MALASYFLTYNMPRTQLATTPPNSHRTHIMTASTHTQAGPFKICIGCLESTLLVCDDSTISARSAALAALASWQHPAPGEPAAVPAGGQCLARSKSGGDCTVDKVWRRLRSKQRPPEASRGGSARRRRQCGGA